MASSTRGIVWMGMVMAEEKKIIEKKLVTITLLTIRAVVHAAICAEVKHI